MKESLTIKLKQTLGDLGYPSDRVVVEKQIHEQFGDYTTNIALVLASVLKQSPNDVANKIKASFPKNNDLEDIKIVNGFLNFYISNDYYYQKLKKILNSSFTYQNLAKGKSARVEYISANPTGPLHIGNARGGVIGETLCRTLSKVGFKVLREYLNNNVGIQVQKLGITVGHKIGFCADEELAYQGSYIDELAQKVKTKVENLGGEKKLKALSYEKQVSLYSEIAVDLMFEEISKDIEKMGIEFDLVVNESDLRKKASRVVEELKKSGVVKEKEGALWLAPSDKFLEDRETVMIKNDGSYTYFVSDIVYHKEKFSSKADLVVDILGSNHHGHVPRLQAAITALGYDVSKFKVILYQYVRVKKGNEVVKMSKRAGNFITAREVLDEVGRDAFNFFMLTNAASTHIDFDLEQALERNPKNPVYYIQYAYARSSNILKKAPVKVAGGVDYSALKTADELSLIKKIVNLPEIVEGVSKSFELQVLPHYALSIADAFHKFYETSPVINAPLPLQKARSGLVKATNLALKEILSIINVSAPERM